MCDVLSWLCSFPVLFCRNDPFVFCLSLLPVSCQFSHTCVLSVISLPFTPSVSRCPLPDCHCSHCVHMLSSLCFLVFACLVFDSACIPGQRFLCFSPEWIWLPSSTAYLCMTSDWTSKGYFFANHSSVSWLFPSAPESNCWAKTSQYNLAMTDSAEEDTVHAAIRSQGRKLFEHEQ